MTPRENSLGGGKILLADASADCRDLVCLYLSLLKFPPPIQAKDGSEALSRALSEQPELIIMEVRLPKLNGFEVVAELRGDPRTQRTWILAATAMAMPGDRAKCLRSGFDAYLAKPYTMTELKDVLPDRSPFSPTPRHHRPFDHS
jgi:CheY-like chemotaxis protein